MSRVPFLSWLALGCAGAPLAGDPAQLAQIAVVDPVVPATPGAAVILDCDVGAGYEVDTWESSTVGDVPVWLASVYETHGNHGFGVHPMGAASVAFSLPGTHVLALASYEPVTWNVALGPDSALAAVIVAGYHEQIVEGIPGVPVIEVDVACGYAYPDDGQGCDTEGLIAAVEAAAGHPLTRFDGCYHASTFQYGGDLAPAPVDEPDPVGDTGDGEPIDSGSPSTPVDTGSPPVVPATGEVIRDCDVAAGYEVNAFVNPAADGTLWLAGVYETRGDHSGGWHPMGAATVHFAMPGTHTLALSAYEPTTWNVTLGPDSTIDRVIAVGYHEQVVAGLPGVPVDVLPPSDAACGYSFPYNGQGCDTNALIAAVESAAGRAVGRFDGCYHASELVWEP